LFATHSPEQPQRIHSNAQALLVAAMSEGFVAESTVARFRLVPMDNLAPRPSASWYPQ